MIGARIIELLTPLMPTCCLIPDGDNMKEWKETAASRTLSQETGGWRS